MPRPKKKLHWMQTEEGKKKFRETMAKRKEKKTTKENQEAAKRIWDGAKPIMKVEHKTLSQLRDEILADVKELTEALTELANLL